MGRISGFVVLNASSANSTTIATLVPDWGANVIAMTYRPPDLADSIPVFERVDLAAVAAKPTSYGIPILAPTPGRVGVNQNGRFSYKGSDHSISPTRHGLLRDRPWELVSFDESAAKCRTTITPNTHRSTFPFEFDAELEVGVGDGALELRLTLFNTSNRTQPLDAGFHPYLHRAGSCKVMLPANQHWTLDNAPEKTPTGARQPVAGSNDFRAGRDLAGDQHWDDIFTDLVGDPSADHDHSTAWVEQDEALLGTDGQTQPYTVRRSVRVAKNPQQGGIRHLQLYTPPRRPAICLEPLSCPPNALNLKADNHADIDLCEVEPGGSVSFTIKISIEIRSSH